MALRPSRLLTSLVAGGLVTGSLLLGAGSALAAPAPAADPVEARCGQTVRAEEGQTVKVIPTLGLPFEREVRTGMEPITQLVGGILCRVQVQVVEPVSAQVAQAAPPLRPATEQLSGTTGAVLAAPRSSAAAAAPSQAAAPTPAAVPMFTPQQAAAAAPAFGSAFGTLPSSFLRSAAGPAPGVAAYDPKMLLGSAFPGLRAGSPAYLGYDPASAVTTASQVQALPVDALTEGGVGVPALIAVLALSGVAAFGVRRIVLGRMIAASSGPSGVGASTGVAAPVDVDEATDGSTDEVDALEDGDDDADAFEDDADEDDAAETAVARRTPVPA